MRSEILKSLPYGPDFIPSTTRNAATSSPFPADACLHILVSGLVCKAQTVVALVLVRRTETQASEFY
jgi:hypothetical protein